MRVRGCSGSARDAPPSSLDGRTNFRVLPLLNASGVLFHQLVKLFPADFPAI